MKKRPNLSSSKMRNETFENSRLLRQSVRWHHTDETPHPAIAPTPPYSDYHYPRMLIEDIQNNVMPYRGMTKWKPDAQLDPANDEALVLIERAISDRGFRQSLYEVVTHFAQECAAFMMIYGKALYEIAYRYDENDAVVGFELVDVLPNSVRKVGKKLIQHIPERVVQYEELGSDSLELSSENLVTFELPFYMRHSYERMMDSLYAQGKITSMPDFVLPNLKGEIPPVPYDLNKFARDQKMAVAEATKAIGWSARDVPDDRFMTEYYHLHRFLRFETFKLELRTSIIKTLNEAISRAGKKLGFEATIVVKGLPTQDTIRQAQESLATGSKRFTDVINPFLAYS